jgi:hypothetical protein
VPVLRRTRCPQQPPSASPFPIFLTTGPSETAVYHREWENLVQYAHKSTDLAPDERVAVERILGYDSSGSAA